MPSAFIKSIHDPIAKEWYARAVVGLFPADGHISPDELDYLEGVWLFLENEELKEELKFALKKGAPPSLSNLDIDRRESARILLELTEVVLRDERFDSAEIQMISELGAKMGFKEGYCRSVLKWGQMMLPIEKAKHVLLAQGISQTPKYK